MPHRPVTPLINSKTTLPQFTISASLLRKLIPRVATTQNHGSPLGCLFHVGERTISINKPKLLQDLVSNLNQSYPKKKQSTKKPMVMKDSDGQYYNLEEIVHRFNNYFANVGPSLAKTIPQTNTTLISSSAPQQPMKSAQ